MSSTSASGRLFDQKGELACPSSKRVQTGEPKFPNISCVWFHTKLRDETTHCGAFVGCYSNVVGVAFNIRSEGDQTAFPSERIESERRQAFMISLLKVCMGQFALLLFVSPAAVWGAFCSPTPSPPEHRHDFQFFAGYSPVSSTLIGSTSDRRFLMAGFGYSYRCWIWSGVSVSYSGEIIPASVLLQPQQVLRQSVHAHAVYGVAATPVGFTADLGRRHKAYPFVQTNEGIIASTEPIPINVIGATGLNFLIDIGGGVRIKAGQRYAISVGYKFVHVSNGGTTGVNPGLDNNVFFAGFSILK